MEVNVDYLGVRVVDLSGAVLSRRVESADFRGSDPATVLGRLAGAVRRGDRSTPRTRSGWRAAAWPSRAWSTGPPVRCGWRPTWAGGTSTWSAVHFRIRPATAGGPDPLDNEATLAARAEADALRPTGRLSFLYLSGEVGIGGALVVDGAVFGGRHGWSGEIGHTVVDPTGPAVPLRLDRLPGAVRRQGRADAGRGTGSRPAGERR